MSRSFCVWPRSSWVPFREIFKNRFQQKAKIGVFGLAAAIGLLANRPADAQTVYTWSGGTDTNWSTAANWLGGAAPMPDLVNTQIVLTGSTNLVANADTGLSSPFSINALTFDINAGSFTVGGPTTLQIGTGGITVANANLQTISTSIQLGAAQTWTTGTSAGSLSVTGATALNGNTLSLAGNGSISLGGVSGTGGLTINVPGGSVTLSGPGSYTGTTLLSAGTLNINNATSLGTGGFTIGSGTSIDNTSGGSITLTNNNVQTWSGNFTFVGSNALNLGTGAVTLSANSIVTVGGSSAVPLTVGGIIGGAFTLTKAGAGTLILTGTNAYTGITTISGGSLQIGAGTAAGTLGTAAVTDNANLNFDRSDVVTVANIISGTGSVTYSGGGTLTLSGTNTFSGTTTINGGGTLKLGNTAALGSNTAANTVTVVSGALDLNGTIPAATGGNGGLVNRVIISGTGVASAGALLNSGTTLTNNGLQFLTLANNASIGGANRFDIIVGSYTAGAANLNLAGYTLTKVGASQNFLSNAEVTAGTISITTSVLGLLANTTFINSGTINIASGAELGFYNFTGILPNTWTINSTAGTIGDTGAGINSLAANLVLTSGTTILTGSTATTGVTLNGTITGTGSLSKTGAGPVVLNGSSISYSGTTAVSAGTLTINGSGFTNSNTITLGGATLVFDNNGSGSNGTITLGNALNVTGTQTLAVNNNGGTSTGNTVVFGALGTPAATATSTTFTSTNGYQVSFSSLALPGTTGANTTLIPTSANVIIAGNVTNPMTSTTATQFDTIILDGATSGNAINGVISDSSIGSFTLNYSYTRLTKQNTSTWTLNGANTYTGPTTVTAGILTVSSGATLGAAGTSNLTVSNTNAAAGTAVVLNLNGNVTVGTLTGSITAPSSGTNSDTINLNNGSTLTVNESAASTFTGVIGGNGSNLYKYNTGILSLTGTNTFTGTATVDGGSLLLDFSNGSGSIAANTLPTNILNPASSVYLNAGSLNVKPNVLTVNSQTIAGLTISGATTVVSTANTATSMTLNLGAITRNVGSTLDFTLPSPGSFTTTTANENFSGGQQTILGGYATVSGSTWAVSGSGATAGTIGGLTSYSTTLTSGIDYDGNPLLPVTTSGALTVNSIRLNTAGVYNVNPGGALTVASGGILVTSTVGANATAINGSTLTSGNGQDLIVIQNDGTALTINSAIVGSIALTKSGTGTLVLKGANTYTGGTFINGGTVSINSVNALGSPSNTTSPNLTLSNATLTYTGVGETTSQLLIAVGAGGATIDSSGTGALQLTNAGAIGFAGQLGARTLTLTGTYQTANAVAGSTAGINVLSAVIADNGGATTLTKTSQLAANTGYTGPQTTWELTGNNTFTGPVNINAGALWITNSNALGTGSKTITIDAGTAGNPTLHLDGTGGNIILGSNIQFLTSNTNGTVYNEAGNNTINGAITLTSGGGGTAFVVDAGTLTLTGTIAANATSRSLELRGNGNGLITGILTAANAPVLIKDQGAGTWTLAGANTYTGSTTVSAGTLSLDFSIAGAPTTNIIAATSPLILNGGTLNINGNPGGVNSQTFASFAVQAGSSFLTANQNGATTLTVSPGTITRTVGGTVDFTLPTTGSLTYTPGTASTILSGTNGALYATISGSDWAAKNAANNAIVGLSTVGGYTPTTTTTLAGNADVTTMTDTTLAATTTITSLRFNIPEARTITATGFTLTVPGILITPAVGNNVSTIAGGTLQGASGQDLTIIQNNSANNLFISSNIQNNTSATGLTKSGLGLVALGGTNTYTGQTNVNAGTLQVAPGGTLAGAASDVVLNNNATALLDLNGTTQTINSLSGGGALGGNVSLGSGTGGLSIGNATATTYIFSGIITGSGTGGVTKTGTSTEVFGGNNTYSGPTSITGGTLQIGNISASGTLGTGAVTIGTGATLSFERTDVSTVSNAISGAGNLLMNVTAAANPGAGAGGTVIFTGALSYTGTTTITTSAEGTTFQIGNGGSATTALNSAIANASALVINESGNLSLGGVVSGAGTFTQAGTGTTKFSVAATYTGATNITAGTLQMGIAQGIAAASVTTIAGASSIATLDLNGFALTLNSITLGGGSSSGGAAITTGSGILTLGGNVTYTAANTPLGATISGTGGLTATAVRTFTIGQSPNSGGADLTINSPFSGTAGGITKAGAGTLLINGAVSYTGATTVSAGTLIFAGANTTTAATTITAGVLQVGNGATTGALGSGAIADNASLVFNLTSNLTTSDVISGTGTLTQAGTGTIKLSGLNTYTGATFVNSGILQGGIASAFSSGSSVTLANVAGAALDLNSLNQTVAGISGGGTTGGNITLETATLTVGNATSTTYTGVISGTSAGGLTKVGSGTLTLNNANTFTGTAAVNAGTLFLDFTAATAPVSNILAGALSLGGGTVTFNGGSTTNTQTFTSTKVTAGGSTLNAVPGSGGITINLGAITRTGGTLNFIIPANSTFTVANGTAGTILTSSSGVAYATVGGNDWAAMDPTNTFVVGLSTISGGYTPTTFSSLSGNADASSSVDTTLSGSTTIGTLRFNQPQGLTINNSGTLTTGGVLVTSVVGTHVSTITGGTLAAPTGQDFVVLQNNPSSPLLISSILSGSGGYTQSGPGTVIFTATNTYTGATSINGGGTLQIGIGGTSGTISTGAITDNGTLAFNRSDSNTYANVISGSGGISQLGTGTVILTGANTNTGNVVISAGTLQVGIGGTAGTLGVTGATAPSVLDNGSLVFNRNDTSVPALTGIISGTGSVTFSNSSGSTTGQGSYTNLLNVANTYSGGTTVTSGARVDALNNATFGTGPVVIQSGGELFFNSSTATLSNSFTIAGNGLTESAGNLGAIRFQGGTIAGNITLAANSRISDSTTSGTISGVISGAFNLEFGTVATVNGTVILTGNNTYSGTTTITTGTLQLGAGGASGSVATGAIVNNATLTFNRTDVLTVGNLISGTGIVNDAGAAGGFVTVTSFNPYFNTSASTVNTFTGAISVTAGGTLSLPSLQGTGAITLGATTLGAILQYSGAGETSTRAIALASTTGAITIDASGTGALTLSTNFGASGAGIKILTLQGSSAANFANTISGVINDNSTTNTTSIVKAGTNTWALTGLSTFTGTTTINGGILEINTLTSLSGGASSLGDPTVAANGTIAIGSTTTAGTLQFLNSAAITSNRVINLAGTTGGAVLDASGTAAVTLSSAFTATGVGVKTLTLQGSSTLANTISGAIVNSTSTTALLKTGTGSWTLSGANTFTGGTSITGGTLSVSFTAIATNPIGNASTTALTLAGGTLNMVGVSAATDIQTFATATLNAGQSYLTATQNGATSLSTALTAITRTIGSTLDLTIPTTGSFSTGTANTGGIVGGYATVGGFATWATGTTTITGLTTYSATFTSGTNVDVATGTSAPAAITVNSVRFNNTGNNYTVTPTGTLTITTGGILETANVGAFGVGLMGTQSITSGNGNDLILIQNDTSGALTIAMKITGTLGLTKAGAGLVQLTNATNTYTLGTYINGGTLQGGVAAFLPTATNVTIANVAGATLDLNSFAVTVNSLAGGGTAGGAVTLGSATLTSSGTTSTTFAGIISGTGGLTKNGASTLTLTGANTFTGAISIGSGSTLTLGNGTNLGTLATTAAIADAGTFIVNHSDSVSLSNAISGAGAFTQSGLGTTTLSGALTYTGATTISAGNLNLGGNSLTTSTTLTMNGNTSLTNLLNLTVSGSAAIGDLNAAANSSGATTSVVRINSGGTVSIGSGSSSTLTIADNTGASGTSNIFGTLDSSAAAASSGNTVTINVGTFTLGKNTVTGSLPSYGTLLLPTTTTAVSSITASTLLTVGGSGQSGASTYTSAIDLGNGLVTIVTPTLDVGNFKSSGAIFFHNAAGGTLTLSGAMNLDIADNSNGGAGTTGVAMTASFDTSGGTIAAANLGTVAIGTYTSAFISTNGSAKGSFTIDGVASSVTMATLQLGNFTNVGNAPFGTPTNTSGTLTVKNGTVTVTGLTTIGAVAGSNNGGVGTLNLNGGTVSLGGGIAITNNVGTTGIINIAGSAVTLGGAITAGASATSSLSLTGGSLNAANQNIASLTSLTFSGGTLQDVGTLNSGLTQSGGTLLRDGTGATPVTIITGNYSLSGSATASITGGTLQIGTTSTSGNITNTSSNNSLVVNGGTLTFGATAGGTITVDQLAFRAGTISGVNSATLTGTGDALILRSTTIGFNVAITSTTGGNVHFESAGGAAGLIGGNIDLGPATRTFNVEQVTPGSTANDLTISGVVSDGGGLIKTGAGTLNLTAANTYFGGTSVSAGTLRVNNTSGSGTGFNAVTVLSGATLGGSGSISGPVTVNSGAFISPGNSPGVLTVANNLTVAGTYNFELATAGSSATVGTGGSSPPIASNTNHDVINVTAGTLTMTGSTVTITSLGSAGGTGMVNSNTYSWLIASTPGANDLIGMPTLGTISGTDFTTASGVGTFTLSVSANSQFLYLNYAPVPEPASLLLIGAAGLGLMGWARRRRTEQAF